MVVSSYLCSYTPSSPESSIFQLEAAGKRLWREVRDPDDFSGTATNCETGIDFENTDHVPGNCGLYPMDSLI